MQVPPPPGGTVAPFPVTIIARLTNRNESNDGKCSPRNEIHRMRPEAL